MLKNTFLLPRLCLSLLLLGEVGFAFASSVSELNPEMGCLVNNSYMPRYRASFSFPLQESRATKTADPTDPPEEPSMKMKSLVLRFYQAWGEGESTGWQTPITPPQVSLDGKELDGEISFSYQSPNYKMGAVSLGMDQFAQYYTVNLSEEDIEWGSILVIEGTFQQVAYISAVIYSYSQIGDSAEMYNRQAQVLDKEMNVVPHACNPYLEENPSVFYYPSNFSKKLTGETRFSSDNLSTMKPTKYTPLVFHNSETGNVGVYRLDRETSKEVVADDIATDGCSRAYLFGALDIDQEVAILRIKVPHTFLDNDKPDKIFGDYQARYLSVGAHRNFPENDDIDSLLNFWTVNARMLNKYKDKEGYAYVFFAPDEYTRSIALEQNTPDTQPPVITWGKYKGYLLGQADYSIIMRYRDPAISWEGSPENAICYENARELQPVADKELGKYTPEIFGDTLENFLNGKIGAVKNEATWPELLG